MVFRKEKNMDVTTENTAQEAIKLTQEAKTSANISEDIYCSGLEESMEIEYTDQIDSQSFQTSGVVIKVEIFDEDYKNTQESLRIDDTVRPIVCLQSMDESNNSETTVQESTQVLDTLSVSSGVRNEETNVASKPTFSGYQHFEQATSNKGNCYLRDPEMEISKTSHESDHVHEALYSSHTCRTFISKDNMIFQSLVSRGSQPYLCSFCNAIFSSECQLLVHLKLHTDIQTTEGDLYFCKNCKVPFPRRRELVILVNKLDENILYYNSLDANIAHLGNLKKQLSTSYTCLYCKKSFRKKPAFIAHQRVHTLCKPYHCEICSRTFSDKTGLQRHADIHNGYKPYRCEICSRRFRRKDYLRMHAIAHTGYKLYRCEICSRTFSYKQSLNYHTKVHAVCQSYRCEICSRTFSQKQSLNKHVNNHKDYKPYRCEICSRRFQRKDALRLHVNGHTRYKLYPCEICSRTFSYKRSLDYHVIAVHSVFKPYQCEICSRSFSQKQNLRSHMRIHR